MEKEEKPKKITFSYSLKDYWILLNSYEKKGLGTGILYASIFTLIWSQIGSYADCISCYYNILAVVFFIIGMAYKFYAHRTSRDIPIPERKEEK